MTGGAGLKNEVESLLFELFFSNECQTLLVLEAPFLVLLLHQNPFKSQETICSTALLVEYAQPGPTIPVIASD